MRKCFSFWLSLWKRPEMKLSYFKWESGLKSGYQTPHSIMLSIFLFLVIRSNSFPTCLAPLVCIWSYFVVELEKKKQLKQQQKTPLTLFGRKSVFFLVNIVFELWDCILSAVMHSWGVDKWHSVFENPYLHSSFIKFKCENLRNAILQRVQHWQFQNHAIFIITHRINFSQINFWFLICFSSCQFSLVGLTADRPINVSLYSKQMKREILTNSN